MDGNKYAVLGVGPVGGIMAAHLASAGYGVFLVDILKDHMEAIQKDGLTVTGTKEMSARFPQENLCHSIDEMPRSFQR
jgi:2-dehydropantoate 2-reductase